MKRFGIVLIMLVLMVSFGNSLCAGQFNVVADNQVDVLGYYYIITGGKFPTGPTPNGDNASGGTFRFLLDDLGWGYPIDTWQKDDWFTDNAGFALTLKNAGLIVYDNNGIEDGTYGDYYNASGSHGTHGLYRGYSMSNNFDWIYAGYFKITQETAIDQIIGYFDPNGSSLDAFPFNPYSPAIRYRMNIWSNVTGDLLPVNTGGFTGDVFSTDNSQGSFSWSDTGVNRIYPGVAGFPEPIYRLVFNLSSPINLQPGIYWFSHDASILPVATNKEACKKLGWQSLIRADFSSFKNQGDCIQYVNTGK
jgi:hypothetical protein